MVPGDSRSSVLVDMGNQKILAPATKFYEVFGFVFTHDIDPIGVSFENRVKIERETEVRFFQKGFSISDPTTGYEVVVEFNDRQPL